MRFVLSSTYESRISMFWLVTSGFFLSLLRGPHRLVWVPEFHVAAFADLIHRFAYFGHSLCVFRIDRFEHLHADIVERACELHEGRMLSLQLSFCIRRR